MADAQSPKPIKRPTPSAVPRSKPADQPTQEQIRQRAYEIYCARNGAPGDPLTDWAQAEAELRTRLTAGPAKRPTATTKRPTSKA